jgi:hypothetical protein
MKPAATATGMNFGAQTKDSVQMHPVCSLGLLRQRVVSANLCVEFVHSELTGAIKIKAVAVNLLL